LSKQCYRKQIPLLKTGSCGSTCCKKTQPAGSGRPLTAFEHEAGGDPGKIYELQLANGKVFAAGRTDVAANLPSNTQTNQSVELLVAECCTMLKIGADFSRPSPGRNWAEFGVCSPRLSEPGLGGQELTDSAKAEVGTGVESRQWPEGSL